MKIGHSKSAATTPAFALIAEGWNDLVQSGMTPDADGASPINAKTQVLYLEEDDGEIVAVLCFKRAGARVKIVLSYVEETSRRRGYYRMLWESLIVQCQTLGVQRVTAEVHPANDTMHAVMRHLERPLTGLVYEKLLLPPA